MLIKTLEVLLIGLQLASHQPSLPTSEQYVAQHQKPPIYAQASEDLRNRLLVQSKGSISPKQGPSLEQDIANFHYHINSAFKKGAKKLRIKEASEFLDYFIEKYRKSSYDTTLADLIPKALLHSGILHCCMEIEKDFPKCIERLREAYELAVDMEVKVRALFFLADIEHVNANANVQGFSLENAESTYKKIIEIAPGSLYAEESSKKLKLIESQKSE